VTDFRRFLNIILDAGDTTFEFNDTASHGSHHRWQPVPEQKEGNEHHDQKFPMTRKHFLTSLDQINCQASGEGG
jgi:hypothetical protein